LQRTIRKHRLAALREELQKLGWTDGRNLRIGGAALDVDSLQRYAKELVALQPDLVLTDSTPVTAAMLQQTREIPIVFVQVADPVGSGFAASLPRPGGQGHRIPQYRGLDGNIVNPTARFPLRCRGTVLD